MNVFICYVDESGTPELSGNTSHFVLAGLMIPIWHWNDADTAISNIKNRYGLNGKELHTAWLLRPFVEQESIVGFDQMDWTSRRSAVLRARVAELHKLQRKPHGHRAYKQAKKNFAKSDDYVHLSQTERMALAEAVASCVGGWGYARLFAESVNKLYHDPARTGRSVGEQGFEQVITRFEAHLARASGPQNKQYGVIVHDNNTTVAKKHTEMMRHFHSQGTLWNAVGHIIETPLFVDSGLTSMVQVVDLCSYAIRKYLENQDANLFDRIFPRADRIGTRTVGMRHFTAQPCQCKVCATHY